MVKVFIHGIASGTTAGVIAMIYNVIYSRALLVDFSAIVNPLSIFTVSLASCLLVSAGYFLLTKTVTFDRNIDIAFNLILLFMSFVSILLPFTINLPTDLESPELFLGLVIPMHFFPILLWLILKPMLSYRLNP